MLLAACLAACTMPATFANFFEGPRTMPGNATPDFGQRHSPALNPGGAGTSAAPMQSGRRVPVENPASSPTSNTAIPAPVAPVIATPAVPIIPVAPTATSRTYPTLADVPPAPVVRPHKNEAENTVRALTLQRDSAETARQALLSNPDATVMTSPKTGQLANNTASSAFVATPAQAAAISVPPAPLPPPTAIDAPAEPAKAAASQQSGVNGWLHHWFGGEDAKTDTATASRKKPSQNVITPTTPAVIVSEKAPMPPAPENTANEKSRWTATSVPAPEIIPQKQEAIMPPVKIVPDVAHDPAPSLPPVSDAAFEPVRLHPPSAASDAALDSGQMMMPEASVQLTPPAALKKGSISGHYLSGSRYAERRTYEADSGE